MQKILSIFTNLRIEFAVLAIVAVFSLGYFLPKSAVIAGEEAHHEATPPTEIVEDAKLAWNEDFMAAKELAEKTQKPMLINFTGSDWCPLCIVLGEEVFNTPEFKAYADESLVLMEVDYPQGTAQSPELYQQNARLGYAYDVIVNGVVRVPQVLLVSPEGEVLGRTSYQPGGPEAYVQHLQELMGKETTTVADNN